MNWIEDREREIEESIRTKLATRSGEAAEAFATSQKASSYVRAIQNRIAAMHAFVRADHNYTQANNERQDISRTVQMSASEPGKPAYTHTPFHMFLAKRGEPVAQAYCALEEIADTSNDQNIERLVSENITPLRSIFPKMITRTLTRDEYIQARHVIESTAQAVREVYGVDTKAVETIPYLDEKV